MDRDRLEQIIGAAQNRYGITISTDDPIFALVFLNEEILNESMHSAFRKIEPIARSIYDAEVAVPKSIKLSADDAIYRLTQIAGSIIRAGDSLKTNLSSEVALSRNEILRMGVQSQNKIQAVLGERLEEVERTTAALKIELAREANKQAAAINMLITETIRVSLADHSKNSTPSSRSMIHLVASYTTACAVAILLTYSAIRFFEDIKQKQAADIGIAVQESWQQLDEKSRAIIKSKINQP
ncbi:hypothetical protein [Pseudomonas sp. EA_35y_Pfl2_R5]|uniref:hypothetical protein n=1 Tax=Pseudomonas sp. EA_35y_Pfl2_R5 TaxID=3088690 RepID=UPI0030D97E4F